MSIAAAQPLTLTEADGYLAPGAVAGGAVQVQADGFVPFAVIGMWAGRLAQPTAFDGVPCAAGAIRVEMGHLVECTLSEAAAVGPITFPARTRLILDRSAAPNPVFRAALPADLAVGGRRYPAGEELVFTAAGAVWFRIQAAEQAPPDVSAPCRWGLPDDRVLLHPDGRLAQCILREAARVDGRALPKNTIVELDASGALTRIDLREGWQWQGQDCPAGSRVLFAADGTIAEVRSQHVVHDDDEIRRPSWRVKRGFYYGYPWRAVLE